ncbi:MAG: PQQ-binding-like beta-propeller repeat protein, partial [Planctomycetota bacterium]
MSWVQLGLKMVVLVLVVLVSTGGAIAADTQWPWWRGPNHDGKSPDEGLLKQWPEGGPELLWKVDFLGSGYSNCAV